MNNKPRRHPRCRLLATPALSRAPGNEVDRSLSGPASRFIGIDSTGLVRRPRGVCNNHLPGALSVNSIISAVMVTLGMENRIKYNDDLSSVWLTRATALPVSG